MSVTVVERACRLLEQEERLSNLDLAEALGLSPGYLQRVFKKTVGVTPQQYRRRVVAERARDGIGAADSVTASVYQAGYSSPSRFYDGVGQELGMPPARAQAGGAGERIDFALAPCSLGQALIAWTARGVCQVAFGDTAEPLEAALRQRFPRAEIRAVGADGAEVGDHAWVRAVIDAVETSAPAQVPLDIRGTAFQERVWQALRAIPRGETLSYAALADAIGRPGSARAVARACASNALAVVIPCHRVVRSDGGLSGYRWGVERKAALLERERS